MNEIRRPFPVTQNDKMSGNQLLISSHFSSIRKKMLLLPQILRVGLDFGVWTWFLLLAFQGRRGFEYTNLLICKFARLYLQHS